MNRLPYFQFMANDWLSGMIATHDMATQGIFINLCARMWKAGGYLPDDEDMLARLLHTDKQLLSKCLVLLKQDKLVCLTSDNQLYVKFIQQQLADRVQLSIKRTAAGRKGGKAAPKQLLSKCSQSESESESDKEKQAKDFLSGAIADNATTETALHPDAKKHAGQFSQCWQAIRKRELAPALTVYAELLVSNALHSGIESCRIAEMLAWLPAHHGRRGVPSIRDPRELDPAWFDKIADAMNREADDGAAQAARMQAGKPAAAGTEKDPDKWGWQ